MIDTVKFKIFVDDDTWCRALTLVTISNEFKQPDGTIVIHNCHFPVKLPSYDHNINILLYPSKSPNHIFVEFSLPKLIFKTNIISPTREQYKEAVNEVRETLQDFLQSKLPPTREWTVQRIDIAVQWQYKDQLTVENVLNVLKQFGDYNFDTTTYKNTYTKFYLKNQEFLKHDYKLLVDRIYADQLEQMSRGLLRFEICLTGKTVENVFHTISWDNIIAFDDRAYGGILASRLLTFYNHLEPVMMTTEEAFNILVKKYTQEMAIKLIGYMRIRDGNNPDKKKTLAIFDRQTRYRWNKLLKDAKIGVNAQTQVQMPKLDGILVWRQISPQSREAAGSPQCEPKDINFSL